MTKILNDPGCQAYGGNTGIPKCKFDPEKIVGMIAIPKAKEFTNGELETFVATCQALTIAGEATRIYPVFPFEEVENKTEAKSVKTYGFGGKKITKRGKYNLSCLIEKGGKDYQDSLQRLFRNSNAYKVILFDNKNYCMGVATAANGMKGFTVDFIDPEDWTPATGEDASTYKIDLMFSKPEEMNEGNMAYFNVGEDVEDAIKGLLDVEMYSIGAGSATKKHIIGIRTVSGKVSLFDAYSSVMVAEFDHLITATKTGATANPVACVAVSSSVPGNSGWELEFAATGDHIITLATPAVLAGKLIGAPPDNGYEVTGTLAVTVA